MYLSAWSLFVRHRAHVSSPATSATLPRPCMPPVLMPLGTTEHELIADSIRHNLGDVTGGPAQASEPVDAQDDDMNDSRDEHIFEQDASMGQEGENGDDIGENIELGEDAENGEIGDGEEEEEEVIGGSGEGGGEDASEGDEVEESDGNDGIAGSDETSESDGTKQTRQSKQSKKSEEFTINPEDEWLVKYHASLKDGVHSRGYGNLKYEKLATKSDRLLIMRCLKVDYIDDIDLDVWERPINITPKGRCDVNLYTCLHVVAFSLLSALAHCRVAHHMPTFAESQHLL